MIEAQSDRILALVESAIKVETEIATHEDEIGARLDDELASVTEGWGEGQEKPNHRALFRALKEKLGQSREKLSRTEEHHIELLKRAVELRGESQELTGILYEDFSSMRRTVEELYRGKGKANANVFVIAGIQGPTARKPTKLLRQVDLAVKHLRQPELEFPVSRFDGTQLEPANLAQALADPAKRLGQVLGDLRQLASRMNASRKEKNRAIDAQKELFPRVARTAEALFRLAGEHELAERIRPSGRRPGRRAVEITGDGQDDQDEGTQNGIAEDGAQASSSDSGDGGSGEPAGKPESTASSVVDAASETAPSSSES